MSTIGTTSLFLGLVNLNVGNEESIHIQTFHLPKEELVTQIQKKKKMWQEFRRDDQFYLSIAFSILKQIQNDLSRLNRPAPLPVWVSVLCLSSSAYTAAEPGEGDGLLVGKHIFQIPLGLAQRKLPDGMRCLPSVLYNQMSKIKVWHNYVKISSYMYKSISSLHLRVELKSTFLMPKLFFDNFCST